MLKVIFLKRLEKIKKFLKVLQLLLIPRAGFELGTLNLSIFHETTANSEKNATSQTHFGVTNLGSNMHMNHLKSQV